MHVNLNEDKEFVREMKSSTDKSVFLYFVRITSKKNVTLYKLSYEVGMDIEFMNWFLKLDESIPQEDFSPNKSTDKYYYFKHEDKVESDNEMIKYPTINSSISLIDSNDEKILNTLKGVKLHNLSGYAVVIKNNQTSERVLYFSQLEKFTTLKKGAGMITNVTNNNVNKLSKESTVGLKPLINCYIGKENKLLVTSKNNFENMFKMSDIYVDEAQRILNRVENLPDSFENFSEFKTHVKRNSRLSKRVASLEMKLDRVELVCANIDKVKEAIVEPKYIEKIGRVKIEDDKIVYEEENVDQIITLLSDLAVSSYITNEKFVAESD